MSSTQPSSAIPRRPNLLAIQGGPSLPAPLPPTPPSCSFPKDRNYFYLKEVDWILFSAMQTVAATPNDLELKYTGPLFQRLTTIQIVGSGTSHTVCWTKSQLEMAGRHTTPLLTPCTKGRTDSKGLGFSSMKSKGLPDEHGKLQKDHPAECEKLLEECGKVPEELLEITMRKVPEELPETRRNGGAEEQSSGLGNSSLGLRWILTKLED
ncbi:uncharacterized protein F5147DRAFT_652005 [Suillus discolor]|uniref:Uncharacterized protein n=1 Tax=Suillus discolor TaxID=1912936 RepID=A0A9P7F8C7_9AGAM|nr:uncharacterized protein F5147DRAFT_652005 [Suillus discolor]KAG2110396.1 hypothetical protein F5147DRAFT_652005 [Suillus discolor]